MEVLLPCVVSPLEDADDTDLAAMPGLIPLGEKKNTVKPYWYTCSQLVYMYLECTNELQLYTN